MNQTLTTTSGPVPNLKNTSHRVIIGVNTDSIFFRNLSVTLYYNKDPKTAAVSSLRVDLKEMGGGVPGLITDSMVPMMHMLGTWIVFDLEFTMEARLGSMEMNGLAIPLPVPAHQCNIHGTYNTYRGESEAKFTEHIFKFK